MEFNHVSVLLNECLEALNIKEDGIYVDCTLGGAGHSSQIVKRLSNEGRLIGIDQDKDALRAAGERLHNFSNVTFVHNNFHNIGAILEELEIEKVDGILMDLGVSSYQLDEGERGFSYMRDAPLDMRMNRENNFSGSIFDTSIPPTVIFPDDASQNLAASLETVVFPPPDGPTRAVTSPCFAVNDTSSRTVSLVSYANFTWSN